MILINGTMGVGKSAVCEALKQQLPRCVMLDGDWCWDMHPFVVNDETKRMVLGNIAHLLNAFLACSQFEYVLFCWVIHENSILQSILSRLQHEYALHAFTLTCSEEELTGRLERDIQSGLRDPGSVARSLERKAHYVDMPTVRIDTSHMTAEAVAQEVLRKMTQEAE